MTEKEKMLSGQYYDAGDSELVKLRQTAHNLCVDFNQLHETDEEQRVAIMRKLIGEENAEKAYIQGPVWFDYGVFTTFGEDFYANFNLTVLDCCPVKFGDNVLVGPNCTFAAAVHPVNPEERLPYLDEEGNWKMNEYAKPITVGNNCWIAADVVVCAGVTIGDGSVIGAGSVVTKDIPPRVFAAGNPCRVIRELDANK